MQHLLEYIWHDVITIAPCLHNFFWAAVQFTGRNPFVHHIVEEILLLDPSLKRSSEEIALVDSYATIRSNLQLQALELVDFNATSTQSIYNAKIVVE
ncbi:hypothetical protein V6N13_076506 [Hibiscus sabdariffa]